MDLTNFGAEKTPKAKSESPKTEETQKEVCEDNGGWADYDHQEILNKEEGYSYENLQLFSKSDLNGIKYEVCLSSAREMPHGFLNVSRRIIIGKVFFKDVYI